MGDSQSHQCSRLRTSKHVADGRRRGMAEGGKKRMLGTSEERRQRESRKRDVVERREEAALVSSMTRINKQSKREGSLFLWSAW